MNDQEITMSTTNEQMSDAPDTLPPSINDESVSYDLLGAPTVSIESLQEESETVSTDLPAQMPPTEAQMAQAEEVGIAAWYNGKKIAALWCNSSSRNSYISVAGMGWKKLSNANDSCLISMSIMAAHAEATNATVNVRTGSDGMVHEIYVW
jgi:hypothetical protein